MPRNLPLVNCVGSIVSIGPGQTFKREPTYIGMQIPALQNPWFNANSAAAAA
jgi:hypothetical protein